MQNDSAKHYFGGHFGDLKVKNGKSTEIDPYCEFLRVSDLAYSGNETLLSLQNYSAKPHFGGHFGNLKVKNG